VLLQDARSGACAHWALLVHDVKQAVFAGSQR
jgi:hypothetical protein